MITEKEGLADVRREMTIGEALAMYPQLVNETVKLVAYPRDGYYPSWIILQFVGNGNYRTNKVPRYNVMDLRGQTDGK